MLCANKHFSPIFSSLILFSPIWFITLPSIVLASITFLSITLLSSISVSSILLNITLLFYHIYCHDYIIVLPWLRSNRSPTSKFSVNPEIYAIYYFRKCIALIWGIQSVNLSFFRLCNFFKVVKLIQFFYTVVRAR